MISSSRMFSKISKAFLVLFVLALTLRSATAAPVPVPRDNGPLEKRHLMTGDGTVAAGWPDQSEWLSWDAMWSLNKAIIESTGNWPQETEELRDAILDAAKTTGVDERYILATVMQESSGNVRVPTTKGEVPNPGLMQTYGHITSGTCQDVPISQRCPTESIYRMVREGTESNADGVNLKDLIVRSGRQDASKYYVASRMYNSGINSVPADGNLSSTEKAATFDYSSDIAHRLIGSDE